MMYQPMGSLRMRKNKARLLEDTIHAKEGHKWYPTCDLFPICKLVKAESDTPTHPQESISTELSQLAESLAELQQQLQSVIRRL